MRRLAGLTALFLPASAAAQLPVHAVTPPPPEHRADPSLSTYQTYRRTDTVTPPPVAGSIVGMDVPS